jgi:type IV secretory pathway VirB2 component (pilin)
MNFLKFPDKFKPVLGYALVVLSFAPQVFFALGKPEIAVPLQSLYQILTGGVAPGAVQAAMATSGAVLLHVTQAPPKAE